MTTQVLDLLRMNQPFVPVAIKPSTPRPSTNLLLFSRGKANTALGAALQKSMQHAPREWQKETGRLVSLLSKYPSGLNKHDLMHLFYASYESGSSTLRHSLEACMSKLLQRSRQKFEQFGVTIEFCKDNRVWKLAAMS